MLMQKPKRGVFVSLFGVDRYFLLSLDVLVFLAEFLLKSWAITSTK